MVGLLPQDHNLMHVSNHILIVEDNEDLLVLFSLVLESVGYQVEAVNNGKDALKHLEETQPQLVLMDIMMPEISGLQVAHRIKQKEDYESLPILLTSALDQLDDKYLSESKADDILYKPFDLDDLIKRVDSLTKNSAHQEITN